VNQHETIMTYFTKYTHCVLKEMQNHDTVTAKLLSNFL